MIDSSLAGVVVAQTELAHVDGEQGLALVRGYELPQLAARCTYEEVAYLVLHGELPDAAQRSTFESTLRDYSALSAAQRQAAEQLGRVLPRPEALTAAMALIDADADEGDLRPQSIRALGRVPALAAAVAGQPAPEASWSHARRALVALGSKRFDPPALRALEVLLSLEAEHGLSASTFACRVSASSGARAGVSLAAATATLTGQRHGGATAEARALLLEASRSDAATFVRQAREQRRRLSGFGHRVYKVPDPRVPPLLAAMEAMGEVPLLPTALALQDAVAATYGSKGVFANIDLFGAVLLDALGVDPSLYVSAFALGITPGWLAHWAEQRQTGRLIRPDSAYTGPPRRPLPR